MRKGLIVGVVIGALLSGGGALAASRYLITSTHQIKPSVLRKLHGARGPAGPPGVRGVTGNTGPIGPAGAPGAFSTANVTEVQGPLADTAANTVNGSLAQCPPGAIVVGGGFMGGGNPPVAGNVADDGPIGNTSWDVIIANNGPTIADWNAYAICAVGSGHVAHARVNATATAARLLAVARAKS